jgi:hypothetical protein
MKTYSIKGCSPSIITDLFEPVIIGKKRNGIYKFNELPVTVFRSNNEYAGTYTVVTCDRKALTELVQRHLNQRVVNLEIKTSETGQRLHTK